MCTTCTVGLSSQGGQRWRGPVWLLPPAPGGHEDEGCVMTDATLIAVPDDDQSTPRRTIRIPDDEWESGQRTAEANGETLSAVIRRRVADYVSGETTIEYRATSRTIAGLVIDNIIGELDDVRGHFPAKHWMLKSREVSAYSTVGRRAV